MQPQLAPPAPWRKIVKHVARECLYHGKPFRKLFDELECGHTIRCNEWKSADSATIELGTSRHHRRRCNACRDCGPNKPVDVEDHDWDEFDMAGNADAP